MNLETAGILLALCFIGIVGLYFVRRRLREKSQRRIIAAMIILLAVCAFALCAYLILAGWLVYGIASQPPA